MLEDAEYDELARVLHGDIETMVPLTFPHGRPVTEAHARLLAVIMRRWLVDGDLKKLLAPLRQSALFDVQGNSRAKAYADRSAAFRYYLTGGIMVQGRPVRHIYESPLPENEVKRDFVHEHHVRLPLKKFLAQPRLYHEGHWFNTEQILRFVANKLGGNHLDFDRTGEWAKLDAANKFMRYGGPARAAPPPGCEVYLILEPSSDEIIGGVHLEVIAAAAAFVQLEIGGVQLCKLQTEKSLIGKFRDLFRRPLTFSMIERSKS
ncbi:hypothetical protein ACVOMT_16560 [Sphingomonas panni]